MRNSGCLVVPLSGWRIGHPQVRADDVDDRLPLVRVVLRKPFKGIQTRQANRRLVCAELIGRLDVQLGDAPLPRVILTGLLRTLSEPLPTHRQNQGQSLARAPATPAPTDRPVRMRSTRSFARSRSVPTGSPVLLSNHAVATPTRTRCSPAGRAT